MENKENLNERDQQINLVLNQADPDEVTIDLARVFHGMKDRRRLYAWLTVLFMLLGICLPLLSYEINKAPLTVQSGATLVYNMKTGKKVSSLLAPDGKDLDLSVIKSSYVLQKALDRTALSEPLTIADLSANIGVQRVLSEESRRDMEVLSAMSENNNNGVYDKMSSISYSYSNTFVVKLTNEFGGARNKVKLSEAELSALLDNILEAYDEYLSETYLDFTLPTDNISVINIEDEDIPIILTKLENALQQLYAYCQGQTETVRNYRSPADGSSLNDLMSEISLIQDIDVGYLASYVYANGIANDREAVLDDHRYDLLVAEAEYAALQDRIASTKNLLDDYKNDEILVAAAGDGEETQTVVAATQYYNDLIEQQKKNQELAAEKALEITRLKDRITTLSNADGHAAQGEMSQAEDDLKLAYEKSSEVYTKVRTCMEEVFDSTFYGHMLDHSAAAANSVSILSANSKKMVLGLIVGAVIGVGLWFMDALIREISRAHQETETKKNAKIPGKEA